MDNDNSNHSRWLVFVVAAFVLAAFVGVMAYNSGVAHGIAQSGKIVVAAPGAPGAPVPYAYPYPYYGWHPWGFGLFGPFFFILFWFMIARAFFWRRGYGGRCGSGYSTLDEWHRRAHEAGASQPPGGGTTPR